MSTVDDLALTIQHRFSDKISAVTIALNEITLEVPREHLIEVCLALRDEEAFLFELLIDVCGIDYLDYGLSEWATDETTTTGFERGVESEDKIRVFEFDKPRFAAVYHLLSVAKNHRVRLKVFLHEDDLIVNSVIEVWSAADWFEREAFDLYGILFEGHPDLRRILTDYGFIGHPFRKDFPLIGNVEMRYDATQKRVVYEPVSIQPRTLVPKVIRDDSRYMNEPIEKTSQQEAKD